MKNLYIVFSRTPYKMGDFIRFFTREEFNHVSIMFDENMEEAYTFGRHYIDTPFFGGFIKDSGSRYKYENVTAKISICKVEIQDESFDKALKISREMFKNKEKYVYNTFSAFISIFQHRYNIENAFTCVEFCVYILGDIFPEIEKNGFYSVGSLYEKFKEKSIYKGDFNISASKDIKFTQKHGIKFILKRSVYNLGQLIKRKKA